MPLARVINDSRQNVPLFPGDTIAVLYQPNSFTALGATGKNDEISFESPGISLAQALARTGGLNDNRADPRGVFVFRMEDRAPSKALDASSGQRAETKAPVIYRIDMTERYRLRGKRAYRRSSEVPQCIVFSGLSGCEFGECI
jgi:polysaccharide export outer membrane protein